MLVRFTYPTYALIGILFSALQIGCALPETETLTDVANCEATETCDTNVPTCGNSQLDEGETCDDGNTDTETCPYGETYCTICDATCQEIVGQTSYCGDQVVDTENGEACDDGNTNEFDDCSSLCQFPLCGNGALDPGEECDDGNDIDTDGCTNVCQLPVCGDSIVAQPRNVMMETK